MKSLLPEDAEPILNNEHLQTLALIAEDNPKIFIKDLYVSFKSNWEENYLKIKQTCTEQSNKELREAIHAVSGSAANMGLNRLSKLCKNIEASIDENTFVGFIECPGHVFKEYESANKAMEDYLTTI